MRQIEEILKVTKRSLNEIVFDGYYYGFKFSYHPERQAFLKAELSATYHRGEDTKFQHYWLVRKEAIDGDPDAVEKLLAQFNLKELTTLEFLFLLTRIEVTPTAFNSQIKAILVPLNTGAFLCHFSHYYDPCRLYCASVGGRWNPNLKSWIFPSDVSPAIFAISLQQEASLDPEQITIRPEVWKIVDESKGIEGLITALTLGNTDSNLLGIQVDEAATADAKKNLVSTAAEDMPLEVGDRPSGLSEDQVIEILKAAPLEQYQRRQVFRKVCRGARANFSEPGMGKTRMMAYALRLILGPSARKIVVAPDKTRKGWEGELHDIFPGCTVSFDALNSDAEWTIINFQGLEKANEQTRVRWDGILVDESHEVKNLMTIRAENAIAIAETAKVGFVATATPLPNREEELLSQLRITKHPVGALSLKDFRARYAGSASNRSALARILNRWMVRDLKSRVLRLPPKQRIVTPIEPTPKLVKQYNEIMNDTRMIPIARQQALMRLLEEFKLKWVYKQIRALPEDEKAMAFTGFVKSAEEFAERFKRPFKAVCVTGSNKKGDSDYYAMRAFQTDDKVRVYSGTLKANAAGINLQRGNHCFLSTFPWTASALEQAECRGHRIGQVRPVFVHLPYVVGSIDEPMMQLIDFKSGVSAAVINAAMGQPADQTEKLIKAAITDAVKKRKLMTGAVRAPEAVAA